MTPLVLKEYGEAKAVLTPEELQALRRLAGSRLTILPGDGPHQWLIKASSFVGTLVTPAIRILIKPKVATANLFHLLEAGGRALQVGPEVFDYQRTSDLVPSFATFFARHLESALTRGIPSEYRQFEERLVGIRGRINLPAQQRLTGLPLPIECQFDEYTQDTHLNRVLRGALVRLLRLPGVTVATRQALHQLSTRLEQVSPITEADVRTPTAFTRLNDHCRPAERLARMILANSSIQDSAGASGAAAFLVDMNKVFEQFVEARLTRYLAGELGVTGQERIWLDVGHGVRMKPDLVFRSVANEVRYVADSKYKLTADGYGREADYYQLLAYTTALNLPEGLLVYCQHDGTTPPREVQVQHASKRLRTWAVRLDRTPADVEAELQQLAAEIGSRSSAAWHPAGSCLPADDITVG